MKLMPLYNFLDTITNEYYELKMTIAERAEYIKNNPHMQQQLSTPAMGYSLVTKKIDSGFRDRLKEIKKAHSRGFTRSTIDTH
jgi:hypothetical protein